VAADTTLGAGTWETLRTASAFSIVVRPSWASTDAPAANTVRYILAPSGATRYLYFRYTGAAWQPRLSNPAGQTSITITFAWDAGDRLRFDCDFFSGRLSVTNLETGDSDTGTGLPRGMTWTGATTLDVGHSGGANDLDGVVEQPTTTPQWLANDEPRVLPDGALLVEEARTNLWEYSSAFTDPPVDHLNGPTVVDGVDAPDGSLSADAVTWASGGAAGQIRDLMADGGFPNGAALSISVFARDPDEADLELLFRDKALVNDFTGGQAMPADWGRLVADVNAGTGTADPLFVLYESTDGADFDVWGGQVEAGAFPTSPIRTSGATATRAGEIPRLAAADGADDALAAVLAGGFAIDYWPMFASTDTTVGNPTVFTFGAGKLRVVRQLTSGSSFVLQAVDDGGSICVTTNGAIAFAAGDHLRITVLGSRRSCVEPTGSEPDRRHGDGRRLVRSGHALERLQHSNPVRWQLQLWHIPRVRRHRPSGAA
jgi:hypothetical protein